MQMTGVLRQARAASDAMDTDTARIRFSDFTLIALQLLLVLLLIRQFQIEGKAFVELSAISFVGFAVHAFLPLRLRLPFFSLLSLALLVFVLGPASAAWIVAIGAVLIAICHLPLPFRWRTVLLFAAGGVLVAQRSHLLPIPWSEAIWPILGSMFMFRLIVYYYDLRHDKVPVTLAQSVSYFAMLPNACFPLFPVVDFKTYRRSHYARDAHATYQRGVDWIVRGIVHLILYRVFYYYLTLAPSEVVAPADLMQYLVVNFTVYLRVSGIFHVVVGMLHLFGFSLPETNNRYLLATSFTDHWRRINIYWKDFMLKVFYYPAVFALKRLGTTRAMIVATLYVFVLTWFLHSYQWFWLRGSWLFSVQDILFWSLFGVLVLLNSLREIQHGRSRSLGAQSWSLGGAALNVAKAFATFWAICVLWSIWTADSMQSWLSLWSALKGPWTANVLLFPVLILVVIVLGNIPRSQGVNTRDKEVVRRQLWRERMATVAMATALVLISVEAIHTRLGTDVATAVHALRKAQLSRLDAAKLERNYYDNLMDVGRFNSQLWEVYSKRPGNWLVADYPGLKRFTGDFVQYDLVASTVSASPYGPITTNRFGMRDKDYSTSRPAGTLRIAVLGPSIVMGSGVGDNETFESVLERRLALEPIPTGFRAVELLNLGVPGYQPPQELPNFQRSLALQPNAVFYIASGREMRRSAAYMAEIVQKRIPIPYPGLRQIIEQSGAKPDMDETEILRRLEPLGGRILQQVYGGISEHCREHKIAAVWIFLPQVSRGTWQEETPEAQRLAQEAGFTVINLDGVFDNHDVDAVRLAEWDEHPNALGHRLIADRIYAELSKRVPAIFSNAAR